VVATVGCFQTGYQWLVEDDCLVEELRSGAFRLVDDRLEAYRQVEHLSLVAFPSLGGVSLVAFLSLGDLIDLVACPNLGDASLVAFLSLGDLRVSKKNAVI
jgi:hypothetical protein